MSDNRQRATHSRLQNDYPFYARKALKIELKEGGEPVSFVLNRAQRYLHQCLEKQLRETGWVRALIVKGRQQGCSTYVGGRYYHKGATTRGKRTFVMAHKSDSSSLLFGMVETYHKYSPEPLKPKLVVENSKHYKFSNESHYRVGTAGSVTIGRGGTIQFFHGSEVAYWENTEGLETGILESVAEIPGTEIILESTANGMTGFFYEQCMSALNGRGDYQLIFIPWYWQEEYFRTPPSDFLKTEEEQGYQALYKLNDGQIFWRRQKILKFGRGDIEKGLWMFMQEYPAHVMEAFQTSGNTLIAPKHVMVARKSQAKDPHVPLIIGVDPGRHKDRTVFVWRRGREIIKYKTYIFEDKENVQMIIAGKVANIINEDDPDMVFIDTGEGNGAIDRLKELNYGTVVKGVRFGQAADEDEVYANKRAEMWIRMQKYFECEEGEVSCPDSDEFQKDITCVPEAKETSNGRSQLVSKDIIRSKTGLSPDIGDATALTFAFPVKRQLPGARGFQRIRKKKSKGSTLSTFRRSRRIMNEY